jgi:hypothetical protein
MPVAVHQWTRPNVPEDGNLETPLEKPEVWRYLLNFVVELISFLLRFRKFQGFNLGEESGSPD